MAEYQCIECGANVPSLYTDFKAGIIRISHCKSCGSVADKYIEYDPVIIFLDAMLLQPQPYRHLLINTQFESHWRLALVLWVCDAFAKLVLQRSELTSGPHNSLDGIQYTHLGLELYLNYIVAASELLALLLSVQAVLFLRSLLQGGSVGLIWSQLITKAVIVASLGRVLAVPALLWGRSFSTAFVWLCDGFVFLSTLQALRVVLSAGKYKTLWTAVAVAVGFLAQWRLSEVMRAWFKYFFSMP
ncbi:protein ARV1 [Aplysia californica]|uniref:Protein ARV n=1 Tax=Aplysia californica TaxID=6500 RepID=A0ABM0JUE1_APLCA|nr:protein ARV1 [Aplysia californica]